MCYISIPKKVLNRVAQFAEEALKKDELEEESQQTMDLILRLTDREEKIYGQGDIGIFISTVS
jgi:hypothetical protein